jgi:hypothetical protein
VNKGRFESYGRTSERPGIFEPPITQPSINIHASLILVSPPRLHPRPPPNSTNTSPSAIQPSLSLLLKQHTLTHKLETATSLFAPLQDNQHILYRYLHIPLTTANMQIFVKTRKLSPLIRVALAAWTSGFHANII